MAEPVTITGIEVSWDAYSPSQNREDLVSMVAQMFHGAKHFPAGNQRLQRAAGESFGIESAPSVRRRLAEGFNLYAGDGGASVQLHWYLKAVTTENKLVNALAVAKHRARMEVTLRGEGLAYRLLSDWERLGFTELARWFKFRQIRDDASKWVAHALAHAGQYGMHRERPSMTGKGRYLSRATQADEMLTNMAYESLRSLTRRMNGGEGLRPGEAGRQRAW